VSSKQEQFERPYVEALLRFLGLHPDSPPAKRDPLDFLVALPGRQTGVEVTRINEVASPGSVNRRESAANFFPVVEQARGAYAADLPRINVSVVFPDNRRLSKPHVPPLARELAVHINTVVKAQVTRSGLLPHEGLSTTYQGHRIGIWPAFKGSDGHWAPMIGGMVRHATEQEVRATVAAKEPKLAEYRKHAPEIWLLIVCELAGNGLIVDPPARPVAFTLQTGFDRVFCGSWNAGDFIEIPIGP
jgi:hypothetical protein